MSKATQPNSRHLSHVQQAAAEILARVNSSPRTPWPSEIEAIVAKVAGAPSYSVTSVDGTIAEFSSEAEAIAAACGWLDKEREHGGRPSTKLHDEAVAMDRATWRKLVIEAEATLHAKDLLVGDPRLPAAEASAMQPMSGCTRSRRRSGNGQPAASPTFPCLLIFSSIRCGQATA